MVYQSWHCLKKKQTNYLAASGLTCVMRDLLLGHMDFIVAVLRLSCPAACGILVPQLGIEPASEAPQDKFLTTGPPGESLHFGTLSFWPDCYLLWDGLALCFIGTF